MTSYKIELTDEAINNLEQIYLYIAEELKSKVVAKRQYERIASQIMNTKDVRANIEAIGIQEFRQLLTELELIRTLAVAHDDVEQGRVAPIEETFDVIRRALLSSGY
ncbi:hypothetical protein EZV73_10915 [Acidaminobacter sp. JC074]|uniref:hypothetical protein n=1 Tax=Acidaminobacter sp. JC074 TaxID=2530199 RepID=UPI001F0E933D|nr:hypothetical protein [Acidaminobacter sp. JC074]MCH4888087.1 hypothetical protein [Acidaminobacter sp. JC074]